MIRGNQHTRPKRAFGLPFWQTPSDKRPAQIACQKCGALRVLGCPCPRCEPRCDIAPVRRVK